ncbi:uncharacterized protein LOC128253715 [Drosophila gunungcola]|uniref:G-protein coupled receptors family 1 profile domain-containing protein n=1 Tax=Drosophila gunungcola TaxID=103775 RepID=A0A9P9YMK2_9MUSC|nr:uncharacterized protein LOC128253715 [Drosophila gunungcola]KAI8039686.1 hypothetical protein M5D96_007106 [Drosophila gunungcola]
MASHRFVPSVMYAVNFTRPDSGWPLGQDQEEHEYLEHSDECIFQRSQPSVALFVLYGLAVPTLSAFGLCTNFINAMVFMRPKMTPSAFSYLAALSWMDCISCLLITMTALSRSYFYNSPAWIAYDYQWQTPFFGISTGAANLILACLSLDRFTYLSSFKRNNGAPRFCRRRVARCMILVAIGTSIVVNMPYFFVFYVTDSGTCHVTDFYYSKFYKVQNWFTFALLALLPAIFLFIGNTAIIIAFRKWTKQSRLCQSSGTAANGRTTAKRYQHQMKLTISIVIVITLYLIGELPAHMTSRKSSLNLLFGGDANKVNESIMEQLEVICITLNALQLSLNIVVYAVINPSFMPEFFLCLKGTSDVCFGLCCFRALRRLWRRCQARRQQQVAAEERVVSSVSPQHLPVDEALPCGCESWASDSGCRINAHCKTAVGTFTLKDGEHDEEVHCHHEPVVFTTRSSACLHTKDSAPDEDSIFSSSFIIIT